MKKSIVLGLVSLLMLSGCTQDIVPEDTSISTESSEIVDTMTEGTEQSIETRTQRSIDIAWDARLEYEGSGLDAIPNVNITDDDISQIFINDENYPELSEAVAQYQTEISVSSEPAYAIERVIHGLYRCDNRLISVASMAKSSTIDEGQVQRTYYYVTWDYNGERLYLTDVVDDYDVFIDTITPLIVEALEACDDVQADEIIAGLINTASPDELDFYMEDDRLDLVIEYYDDEFEIQKAFVKVDYREYADLFDPCYLPGDGTMISEAMTYEIESVFDDYGYYDEVLGGTVVYNYNGRSYMIFEMTSSEISSSDDDHQDPAVYIYDLETGEMLSFENRPLAEACSIHIAPYGSCDDILRYIESHV